MYYLNINKTLDNSFSTLINEYKIEKAKNIIRN